ncbi:MAG TPA: GNAT family N-acetyltransferase [Chitinophagaceae bacterium]|nr:GNAT family N-acetyltransferase [Chitinophagaceae bacterium]
MNKGVLIREIQKEDNPQLAQIIRSVLAEFKANRPGTVYFDPTTDDLFSLFRAERSKYFTAEIDGIIVGGAGVYPTEALPAGCCELVKLYLSAAARGKGAGRALIENCFEAAKSFGYTSMYLESMPELSTAIGLYQRLGFTHLPGSMGNSGHFGCDIWMIKQL